MLILISIPAAIYFKVYRYRCTDYKTDNETDFVFEIPSQEFLSILAEFTDH